MEEEAQRPPNNRARRLFGAATLMASVAYGVAAVTGPSFGSLSEPGPAVMPCLVAALGIFGSLGLVFSRSSDPTIEGDEPERWPTGHDALRVVLVLAATVAYAVAIESIGYVVSTLLFSYLVLYLLNQKGVVRNAIASIAYSGLTYMLFVVTLGVPLPSGLLL